MTATIRDGRNATDTSTEFTVTVTVALRDGIKERKLVGGIVDCLQAKPRKMGAGLMFIRVVPTTIIRMTAGGSSSVVPSLICTGAWTSTDYRENLSG
jgi:hypothetical protein